MTHLFSVSIERASESTLQWIDKSTRFSYYEETIEDLLRRAVKDELQFWRANDEEVDGIVATRLVQRSKGTELWIEFICGKGFMKHADAIHDELHEIAKRAGAFRVSGIAARPGLARLYERMLGVKPSATIFSEGVKYGQV